MRELMWAIAITFLPIAGALWGHHSSNTHPSERELRRHTVENIVQILVHGGGEYTLFVQKPGFTEVQSKPLTVKRSAKTFFSDVQVGESPYLYLWKTGNGRIWKAEFHLRSADDLVASGAEPSVARRRRS